MRVERPRNAMPASVRGWRRILLPFGIYLCVTIGVPLLNGASARPEFWEHALEVVTIAMILVAVRSASTALERAGASCGRAR